MKDLIICKRNKNKAREIGRLTPTMEWIGDNRCREFVLELAAKRELNLALSSDRELFLRHLSGSYIWAILGNRNVNI